MGVAVGKQGLRTSDRVIIAVLALAGILLLSYPTVVTYLRNQQQSAQVDALQESVSELDPTQRQGYLDEARAYNAANTGAPILDPWLARVAKDNAPYQDYVAQLNPTGKKDTPMAALSVPSIGVRLPIYHGTEMSTLEKGVGHLYGSALPVGGVGTHSVLTGHSGLTTATLFDHLDQVAKGDAIYVQVMGETLKYEVNDIKVVLPDEVSSLQPVAEKDLLTLITCTPYGINTHRLLVTGTRVPLDADETESAFAKNGIWQTWMLGVIAFIAAIALFVTFVSWRSRRKAKATETARENTTDYAATTEED